MAQVGVGIITLLVVLVVALVATRIAATALMLTGMAQDAARFQARSAFMGVGFTTGEAEQIVNHPVRRRIVMNLMLFGNAGIITAMASLVISFSEADGDQDMVRFVILAAGIVLLLLVARSRLLDRVMHRLVERALRRWTHIDTHDYVSLLDLDGRYAVTEIDVQEGDWIAGRTLADARLRNEGVIVLGIRRANRKYVGAPRGHTHVKVGDTLFAYGHQDSIGQVADRPWGHLGEQAHQAAVAAEAARRKDEEQHL